MADSGRSPIFLVIDKRSGNAADESVDGDEAVLGSWRRWSSTRSKWPRTTKLYDRRNDRVTLDEVERIVL